MRPKYHSRVYLRFMALSTALLPLCTGRCTWRQMLGCEAMAAMVASLMSLGWEVVKRTRMSGALSATIASRRSKPIVSPPSAGV